MNDCLLSGEKALAVLRAVDAERIALAASAFRLLAALKDNSAAIAIGTAEIEQAKREYDTVVEANVHTATRAEFELAARGLTRERLRFQHPSTKTE